MNALEVSQWFRARASEFNGIANMLEGEEGLTLNRIKSLVSGKAMRSIELAEKTNSSRDEVLGIVLQDGSGLKKNERGWITLNAHMEVANESGRYLHKSGE